MAVAAGLMDVQQMPLYDRIIFAAAAVLPNPIQFFTLPIGQGVGISTGVKQVWDTNMTDAQKLPSPRSFLVRALRVYFENSIRMADLQSFFSHYVVALIVGEKNYQLAPLWFHPAGGGLHGGMAYSTAELALTTQASFVANGVPDPRSINVIDAPLAVKIEQGENFRVEFQGFPFTLAAAAGTTLGTGADIRVVLDGVLSRQVQ